MFCKKCGTNIADGAKFCSKCGTPVNGVQKVAKKRESADNNANRKKCIYIMVGVCVLMVAVILAVSLALRGKKAKEYAQYMESAEKYIEELDYEQAKDYYLQAIHIAPKELEPYVRLAKIYVELNEVEKAQKILALSEENKANGDEQILQEKQEVLEVISQSRNDLIEEGAYIYDNENGASASENISSASLEVFVDEKGATHVFANIYFSEEEEAIEKWGDNGIYEHYIWDSATFTYQLAETENKPQPQIVIEQSGDDYLITLRDENNQSFANVELVKSDYLTGVNVTLAVKNYFRQERAEENCVFSSFDFHILYAEMYLVPVYLSNGVDQKYTVVVSDGQWGTDGLAQIYYAEDIDDVIQLRKEWDEIEILAEFNAYDYLDHSEEKQESARQEYTVSEICTVVSEHYNKENGTNDYVVFESECEKTEEGYFLILRNQGGSSANVLVTGLEINLETGEVVDDWGYAWNLYD